MKSGYIAVSAQKKSPDNERLFNVLHQIAPIVTNRLLADAEAGEDGGEDVGGGDGTGYGAEVVEGLAEVLGEEVGRETGCHGVREVAQGVGCVGEGLEVAGVGYQCVACRIKACRGSSCYL